MYTVLINRNDDIFNGILTNPDSIHRCKTRIEDVMYRESAYTTSIYSPTFQPRAAPKMIASSIILNNVVSALNYQNVLLIPSFKNSNHQTLLDDDDIMSPNISSNSFPIITNYFNCSPNIYVALPNDHSSFMIRLYQEFNVNVISSNQMYVMGDETYEISVPDGVVFDAVILGGININQGETFQASDIKNDFSQYCTPEFDLIDIYEDNEGVIIPMKTGREWNEEKIRLTGTTKDLTEIFEYINNNTLPKDNFYDEYLANNLVPVMSKAMKRIIKVY